MGNKCEGFDVAYNYEAIGIPDKDLTVPRFLYIPYESCDCEKKKKAYIRKERINLIQNVIVWILFSIFFSCFVHSFLNYARRVLGLG